MASGGMRPTAPQNNPMNVNPLGGNGQSGNIDYSGFNYGMNQAINQQRQSAPITAPAPTGGMPSAPRQLPEVVGITEPSAYPNESVTTANNFGTGMQAPGVLPEMGQPLTGEGDTQMIKTYLPALEFWSSMPGTPQETIDYVRYLRTIV